MLKYMAYIVTLLMCLVFIEPADASQNKKILEIVKKYSSIIDDEAIFFHPHIPSEKLLNAMASYAVNIRKEDALVLIDDTVMGGAKEGAIVTSSAIYVKNLIDEPIMHYYSDISLVSFTKGGFFTPGNLRINNRKFLEVTVPKNHSMDFFASMLSEILDVTGGGSKGAGSGAKPAPNQDGKSPSEALRELKQLFDEGLITPEEYEKRRKVHIDRL